MHHNVLLIGLLVGAANFLFRYLPLRLVARRASDKKRGLAGILLDTIGIASICALLVVSAVPDILQHPRHWLPAFSGFALLAASFARTRSIILPTLISAAGYGLVWKLVTIL